MAENVKGLKPYLSVLKDEYNKRGYRMTYTLYNSKYWGVPQNRERYFVVGIRENIRKAFQFPRQQTNFIPKLSSVLESEVDEKFYIDDLKAAKIIEQAVNGLKVKQQVVVLKEQFDLHGMTYNEPHGWNEGNFYEGYTGTVTSRDYKGPRLLIEKQPKIEMLGLLDMKGNETVRRVYDPEGLSPTLTTSEGGHRQPKILTVGNTNPSGKGMNDNVFDSEGLAPTLTTNKGEGVKILNQYRVRKLTPREYARLQGFPESYKQVVSNSQFYKQMGNAVTVNVAQAIAEKIKEFLLGVNK